MILVIDDNQDLARIFCEYLNMVGYKAMVAYSGEEGISIAKEQKPRVVLCDIAMSGMSGHDVAKCIREDDELKDVYLIALSGYSSQKDVERSLEAGFDQHLRKPVSLAVLKQVLDEC